MILPVAFAILDREYRNLIKRFISDQQRNDKVIKIIQQKLDFFDEDKLRI